MNVLRRFRNPVLMNELKLRMRTKRSPWIITLYLLVLGTVALTFVFLMTGAGSYYNPNETRELFMMLSLMQLAMICFVVPGLTAGVISGERERQTLSILLTTNVSATKLVLGKWLASLSFMSFLVFATIPLYAIIFLYGGVSPVQLLQVFAFYVVTMLGLGSVGVLLSTLIKRTGIATVLSYALVFGYGVGTSVLAEVIREFIRFQRNANNITGPFPVWPDFFHSLNPLFAMMSIFEEGPFRGLRRMAGSKYAALALDPYAIYCLFFAVVTIICLALSIYLIKPVKPRWRRKAATGE
ncbi:ABC transporter permease [Brevibacillus borstelensis]|uniref:ABC transporter permease n=1 Tax=Brevibacillus borstelensis TaxID=45462 RepID=UPI001D0B11CE|nr:ABC transporter permease [Brevibacillus borstelensis]MCC0563964.1 ABC transporter permease [Brevibacillus borstelensis]MCM3558428.1 ABC transporter permease [Brevibacillus borstelensis]